MRPESVDELFRLLESLTNLERDPSLIRHYRLDRMERFLSDLGHPERERPVIHIAGSKGKGSTAAFLTSLLAACGKRVGMYTSPHVTGYRERFTVVPPGGSVTAADGSNDPAYETTLLAAGRVIWSLVEALRDRGASVETLPTTFELLTALAFRFFPDRGCDWVVLETGLGGRLDATNVCEPELSLLTRIELEHTDYLGDTIALIAGEKAGIIKPGVPVLTVEQRGEAMEVFERVAAERNAPLWAVPPLEPAASSAELRLPSWIGGGVVRPAMGGRAQRTNIALALAALERLGADGRVERPSSRAVRDAIEATRLPGRGERVGDLLMDGAHTPESVAQVVDSIPREDRPGAVVFGAVAGKDVEGMAGAIAPLGVPVVVSRPGTFKPGDPTEVARRLSTACHAVELELDPAEALRRARAHAAGRSVLVTGSFYMVAEIRRLVVP